MVIFKRSGALREYLQAKKNAGLTIGFVPTMGALHAGHISLLREAKTQTGFAVASIFVNPTQFNDPKDFEKYPITIESDVKQLLEAGCDALFLPTVKEMYPDGTKATQHYDLGSLETVLEGEFRPGHFQGVCTIVHRLLKAAIPDKLFMGQKDYQQCMVIRRLLQVSGLEDHVALDISPTRREETGLAMSSRNMRLSPEEKEKAIAIYQALQFINKHWREIPLPELKQKAWQLLTAKDLRPDYVAIVDANDLTVVENNDTKQQVVALIAAFMGEVRLIDNLLLT